MFYSQFILAKKGPLGTIWIAAHLERKLRKNQVADTDIGVSVDSILFPEVPIALRLSSHLLLGVVRIYSRKVNYLFDDCSEALLKIKQAFRSTAVDLPPEESTAPYHSITLPETFDLDDFELPDNDILQGNYVDHHTSARDQITLQDTMDGVVYSTSQFGLDERFADGDASQVGLDLEEELFENKDAARGLDDGADHAAFDEPCPEDDAIHEREPLEALPVNGTRNKVEGLAGNSECNDSAQAPSTPGLVEEPNLTNMQEGLAYDDNLESEDHEVVVTEKDSAENAASVSELHHKDDPMDVSLADQLNSDTVVCMPLEENGCVSGDVTDVALDRVNRVELNNGDTCNNVPSIPYLDKGDVECELRVGLAESVDVENSSNLEKSSSQENVIASNAIPLPELHDSEHANVEVQDGQTPDYCGTLGDQSYNEQMMSTSTGVLQACTSHMIQHDVSSIDNSMISPAMQSEDMPCSLEATINEETLHGYGTSSKVQGNECRMTDGIPPEEHQILESMLSGENQADTGRSDRQLHDRIYENDQFANFDGSHTSDLPAPEKMLLAPHCTLDKPINFLAESTPDRALEDDGSISGTKISGRKRSFTESSLTVQSLNSVEYNGMMRSMRTADFIPDDDDLLSSILVGRRSSVLKLKPTPPAPQVTTMKRSRTAKSTASKRKVLVDDSMVLLGDIIRQQLTNTEDIRRIRKKAPCTRTEVLIIQRHFLEEQVFNELVLTGVSSELASLQCGNFDLSRIMVSENVDNIACFEDTKDKECPDQPIVNQGSQTEYSEPVICTDGMDGEPAKFPNMTENQQGDNHDVDAYNTGIEGCMNAVAVDIANHKTSEFEPLGEIYGIGNDVASSKFPDTENHSAVPGIDTTPTELVSGGIYEIPSSSVAHAALVDEAVAADTEDPRFLREMTNGEVPDGNDVLKQCMDKISTELGAEEIESADTKVGSLSETGEGNQAAGFTPTDHEGASLANMSSETEKFFDHTSMNVGQDIENHNLVDNVDGSMTVNSGWDEKDETHNHLGDLESKMDSTYLTTLDEDDKNASISDRDHTFYQEADQQSAMEFQDDVLANDTEFLNVDDEDMDDEDDNGMPGVDDARIFDNSGWSSRTRAVAKYLQNLFEKEHGRRVLSVNSLLVGKTRKEASRMFFETLVLKTRDYIHVEQVKPFDNISIRARPQLMKSDF